MPDELALAHVHGDGFAQNCAPANEAKRPAVARLAAVVTEDQIVIARDDGV